VDLGGAMRLSSDSLRLAYSTLVGPILWLVHFVLVYAFTEFGCRAISNNIFNVTPENIRIATIVITIPVLILVAMGGLMAFGGMRRLNTSQDTENDRERFLTMTALMLSSLFLFIIVMTILPSFVMNVCDKAT
jgi:heme/copper-type cytochrome/quinol oxidase subunit 2